MSKAHSSTAGEAAAVSFQSSDNELNDDFAWAVARSSAWVQSGDYHVPSYWAGYPQRALFYSRDLVHQLLGAHLLGLDAENFSMMKAFAASATPARDGYPLWSFGFDGSIGEVDYRSDVEFVRETPVVYELVEKALEQYLWTADPGWVSDADLAGYRDRTLGSFAQQHDPLQIGLAGVQPTNDLFRGLASYNEWHRGAAPAVAADGVACQWAALVAASSVLPEAERAGILDPDGRAQGYEHEAAQIENQYLSQWWDADQRRFASGLSDDGFDFGWCLEASWFPVLKGLLHRSGERAAAYLDFISQMLSEKPPHNIEATTYLPEVFWSQHRDQEALRWLRHAAASRDPYPEVAFTTIGHLVAGLPGIRPTGLHSLQTDSHLVDDDSFVEVRNVPVGQRRLALTHQGRNSSSLTNDGTTDLEWTAVFPSGSRHATVAPGHTVVLSARPA